MKKEGYLNIANIADGALVEQVDAEIRRVLENIADVNTDPCAKRKIIIHLTFEGKDDRDVADVSFQTKAVICPSRKQTTRIAFEMAPNGQMVAEELRKGKLRGQTEFDTETGEITEPKIAANQIRSIK